MKVLLINPPVREQYPSQTFPFGLAYVAKYLIKAGHKVQILDIDTQRYSRDEVIEMTYSHDLKVGVSMLERDALLDS